MPGKGAADMFPDRFAEKVSVWLCRRTDFEWTDLQEGLALQAEDFLGILVCIDEAVEVGVVNEDGFWRVLHQGAETCFTVAQGLLGLMFV